MARRSEEAEHIRLRAAGQVKRDLESDSVRLLYRDYFGEHRGLWLAESEGTAEALREFARYIATHAYEAGFRHGRYGKPVEWFAPVNYHTQAVEPFRPKRFEEVVDDMLMTGTDLEDKG